MAARKKSPNFESSMAELETLVETLEQGDLPLEKALAAFEKGVKLTRDCQQALSEAEQKVTLLTQSGDQISEEDFDVEPGKS